MNVIGLLDGIACILTNQKLDLLGFTWLQLTNQYNTLSQSHHNVLQMFSTSSMVCFSSHVWQQLNQWLTPEIQVQSELKETVREVGHSVSFLRYYRAHSTLGVWWPGLPSKSSQDFPGYMDTSVLAGSLQWELNHNTLLKQESFSCSSSPVWVNQLFHQLGSWIGITSSLVQSDIFRRHIYATFSIELLYM